MYVAPPDPTPTATPTPKLLLLEYSSEKSKIADLMYPDSLPPPISTQTFYVLLALSLNELHVYAIKGAVFNCSLGSVNLTTSRLYALVNQLQDEGFIDLIGRLPAGKSGKERLHYSISSHGAIRLQEELLRQSHAVKIATANGLLENKTPTDVQRLLLKTKPRTSS